MSATTLTADWWQTPFKYLLLTVCAWMGTQVDIEPARIYLWLWCFDIVTFVIKDAVLNRRLAIETIIKRAVRHISVLIIPFTLVLLAKTYGKDYEQLHAMFVFMASLFLSITTISNIASLFTLKEYNNDDIMGKLIESVANKLSKIFKK
jgi:hypothetical protein